jgi:hypothetical protein
MKAFIQSIGLIWGENNILIGIVGKVRQYFLEMKTENEAKYWLKFAFVCMYFLCTCLCFSTCLNLFYKGGILSELIFRKVILQEVSILLFSNHLCSAEAVEPLL